MNEEAQAYKERVTLEAQGEVARFEELLPQYEAAPIVTRQRIYLETMEQVFSNTTKVLIDNQGGGNMMYLPLDKIMERQSTQQSGGTTRNSLDELRNAATPDQPMNSTTIRGTTRSERSGRN
jgi:membrane protease subunit HflK